MEHLKETVAFKGFEVAAIAPETLDGERLLRAFRSSNLTIARLPLEDNSSLEMLKIDDYLEAAEVLGRELVARTLTFAHDALNKR